MKKALYIGWIGYKNLSDELMFDLFKEHFSAFRDTYKLDSTNIEYRFLNNIPIQDYDLIILGGGSFFGGTDNLVHPYIIQYLDNCLSLKKKVIIWGTGIDWAPKSFIKKLDNNEPIPFTISPTLKQKVARVFNECSWVGVRGPLSKKILQVYGVEDCQISGDPTFLLTSPKKKEKNCKKVIGVNWGTSFNNIYGENELKVEDELAHALNNLIDKGYHIYLYTLWESDLPAIASLYSKLKNSRKVTLDSTLYNHNELIEIIQQFAFTINFKLYANYISLAANTPFIALGYRFKVYDFVKSIQLEDYIIGTDEKHISDKIMTLEHQIIQNESALKDKISKQVDFYRKKISEPFKNKTILLPN